MEEVQGDHSEEGDEEEEEEEEEGALVLLMISSYKGCLAFKLGGGWLALADGLELFSYGDWKCRGINCLGYTLHFKRVSQTVKCEKR